MSGVRGQHLQDSDRKPLGLAQGVPGGQQAEGGAGTRLGAVGRLTELDALTWSLRAGEIFHWRAGGVVRHFL